MSPLGTATQTDDGSDLGFRPAAAKVRVPASTTPPDDDLGFRPAGSPGNDLGFRPAAPQATTQPIETPQTAAASKGPTIGPAPEPSMWDRLKSSIANSAIGYAVEERLPKLSGALGIHPTETAANPYAEQHAHEIIAPGAAFPKPGVAKGVAEFAGSLATPENVELLAATGGLGALEPIIGKVGATAIGRLVAAGFTGQMIHDAIQKWPGFKEAWDNKDTGTAQQLATEALLDLVVAHQAFRHAATEPGATPQEKFGATLDRSKAVAPEPAAPRPQLPAAPIITPPPAGAVAVPEKTPMPGYLRPEPEWLAQNRGLPAGPETKALPPAPSEAIERAANVNIAPGEKSIPLPAQTPTRIGPGAEPIPAGPSSEAAALGFRPIRKGPAEAPAAKPAPSVNELRSQLAELDARYKRLDDQLRRSRSYNTTKQVIAKLRPLSEERKALRSEIERIEPRPEAKPLTISPETKTGRVVPERGPAMEKPPENPPRSATPTWDSLPPEHQEVVRAAMEGHEHMPQGLREGTEVELKKLSDKGTPLREQFARLHAKDLGLPVHGERAGVTASDFLASIRGARPEVTPFSTTAETPARPGLPPGPGITRQRSAEAREQRITGGKNATPADMQATLEEDIRQLEEKTRSAKPGLERQLAEGRLKQNREMLADLRAGKAPAVEQPPAAPSSPEQLAKDAGLVYKGEAVKGSGVHQFEHPDFPGATMAVREHDLSTPEALGERMQANLAEKPIVPKPGETASSVEFMRALSDRKPEAGIATPEMLRDLFSGRLPKEAWQRFVAEPVIEKGLGIGEKYLKVREADPEVAGGLHLLDNAPAYFRAKAAQNVHDIIGDLSREQERLFSLMADADSRENLRTNHPQEFRKATNDPAIQEALANYKPIEQQLTATRERLGGATLDRDYLRRVYDQHIAGINQAEALGTSERATTAFDRVVRPQKIGNLSREATAEYHYEHGLHEFGPAFGTKFIGTHLAALRDQIARDFISKATEIAPGAAEPRSITYKGEKYFRPDIAREMREAGQKDVKAYDRYDPNAGVKYPEKGASKFLGPREVVRALNDYGAKRDTGRGPVGRFLQEQVIGYGLGIPHVANILRRVTQSAPLGAANPEAWARAWKVAFDKGLRARGLEGVDDPTFDKLLQHGAITTGEMANLKAYWGGNLNPANWAKTLAGVGHKLIFEPGSFGGIGGVDQRARIYIADLLKSQKPEMSDAEIGKAVNTQLGDYNRANWNDRQKVLSKFVLFPGWDASSIRWVIEHPIKTTVPPALLVWTANQVLHGLGQNRGEDASDISNIHFGDRSIGITLLRESMGRNLARPLLNFAQSKIRGESTERATAEASRGVAQGAGGVVGTLRPDITAGIDLAMNRSSAFGGRELVSPEDYKEPGRVLPNRALEKQAALIVRHAIPALDRMMSSDQEIDFKSFAGSNIGLPNYQDGAEQKLKRNVAEAMEVSTTITKLAKTKPDAAREFIRDPDNAAYALFRNELERMGSTLKRIDAAKDAVSSAKNLSAAEKSERLDKIAKARENLLRNADGLDALLFKRKQEGREKPPAPTLSKRPVVETNLGR